jgi:protein-tyrosine phosphatase
LDESVAMLELAAASGTTDIVATPHASGRFEFEPALVGERIAELRDRVAIRIHRGCDLHLHFDNIQDAMKHPAKYSINGRGYLLVEFPEFGIFSHADDILAQLVDAGPRSLLTRSATRRCGVRTPIWRAGSKAGATCR